MEGLDKLPLPLLIAMGVSLALIFGVRYLGLLSGERANPANNTSSAQVAAVIVDPTALNRLTDQAGRLVVVLEEMVDQARERVRVDNLMVMEIDRLREELRIQREIARRS